MGHDQVELGFMAGRCNNGTMAMSNGSRVDDSGSPNDFQRRRHSTMPRGFQMLIRDRNWQSDEVALHPDQHLNYSLSAYMNVLIVDQT
uniref:Uncharacterized protein n=2 Tax=Oryza TaxID=4527 RepID=A0A0E0P569_ORYRU